MSIRIGNQIAVKLFKEEYNLIILMRNKYRYANLFIKVHNGLPMDIEKGIEKTSLRDNIKDILSEIEKEKSSHND